MLKTYPALLMACLGVSQTGSIQQAVASQVLLLPARGCRDQPKLSRGKRQSGWWLCRTENQGTQFKRSMARSEGGLVVEVDLSHLEPFFGGRCQKADTASRGASVLALEAERRLRLCAQLRRSC